MYTCTVEQPPALNNCELVLAVWKDAEKDSDRDRALMWLGFLPQCLLRRPTRGGKAGRRQVAKRFLFINNEDCETLVTMWETDSSVNQSRSNGRR